MTSSTPPGADAPFTRVVIENGQAPWGKNLADIDGDGFLDVIVGGGGVGSNVHWYRYPNWTKSLIGTVGGDDDLQVADINGDGAVDVIVNGGTYWYENPRGSGGAPQNTWTRHTIDASNNGHDLVIGDVNGDGRLDVVTRGEFGPTTLYLQSNPDSWTKVNITTPPNGEGTALADIDRDGRVDVVGNGYWLRQPSDPVNGAWTRFPVGSWPAGSWVAVADINRDGRLDVLLSASEVGVGQLAWFEAPADPLTGTWTRHDIDTVEDVHRFHVVDVNKDGKLDIVFAEMHQSISRRVGVYYGDGAGGSWRLQVLATTGGHNIAVGDIGNDGDIDILLANWNASAPDGGALVYWRNDLTTTLSLDSWSYFELDNARAEQSFGLSFADIDGDGRKDIVAGRYWYRNPGGDMSGPWSRNDFGADTDAMLVLDVDGDGRLDVIAQGAPGSTSVPVYWLRPANVSATSWSRLQIGSVPSDPADGRSQGYALGRVLKAGKPEILFSSVGVHYFQIPSDPSAGNWPRVQVTSAAREEGIAVADIDGDGDLDLVGFVAPAGSAVAWWENPGTGAANWVQHNLGTTSGIEGDRIVIADINRDGRPDVVVTETNLGTSGNSVFWFAQPADPRSSSWPRAAIATGQGSLNSLDVADVDGDGKPDVITGEHRGSLKVTVWENVNDGASWTSHQVFAGKESHLGARVADLDGDGDLDVISIAWDGYPFLHLWRNNALSGN